MYSMTVALGSSSAETVPGIRRCYVDGTMRWRQASAVDGQSRIMARQMSATTDVAGSNLVRAAVTCSGGILGLALGDLYQHHTATGPGDAAQGEPAGRVQCVGYVTKHLSDMKMCVSA
jgi:hypothetical protein